MTYLYLSIIPGLQYWRVRRDAQNWLTMTSTDTGIHLIFGPENTNTFKKLESEYGLSTAGLSRSDCTFHFWAQNTNTISAWEKSTWAHQKSGRSYDVGPHLMDDGGNREPS